ncbi:ImmA/IrrE family metallo-endopeptidase [Cellvibrio fontiphilus]|uniref:ImmA/IrrE family metallo-endopeptidase n=1 Tax=Cellvibrio fontiphilus TaxID=1815559 RepID=A0ABV7FDF4_9GAMM
MNHIKIIKTDQEHEQALAYLMSLMDKEIVKGSAEADELDVLALLIERYEEERYPIDPPDPIEAIKFRMEQQGLRNKDLIPYIGSASKVTEVLNGKRPLSLNMIRRLSESLGISAQVLIRESQQKSIENPEIDWLAFPLAKMRERGYFDGFNGSLQELKEYAAEHLSAFLSSVSSGFSLRPALLRTSAHLRSNEKETDSYAIWAWQVRILQKAHLEQLPVRYEKNTVNLAWMKKLVQLSWSEKGPLLAKEYLNRSGIHLVFEEHLPKTYLDGAVCLTAGGNPVIALTLRHDKLDNFWFTLMHELAHIALHMDGSNVWFIDDLDFNSAEKIEQEADALAQQALISIADFNSLKSQDPKDIKALAKQLSISPCIIAGRIRFESGNHKLFGSLFRDKVKQLIV